MSQDRNRKEILKLNGKGNTVPNPIRHNKDTDISSHTYENYFIQRSQKYTLQKDSIFNKCEAGQAVLLCVHECK